MRAAGGGRIVQLSSYGGQVAFPGNSLYHATKWGIEGFCRIGGSGGRPVRHRRDHCRTGRARTEFRYGSAQVADALPAYAGTPARSFEKMLDPANGLAPGDPARMAAAIIDSVDRQPAPLRMVLGSQALDSTVATLRKRVGDFENQKDLAASTDYPVGV